MTRGGPLAVPAFRSLWLSGLVSDAGDWLLFIALPLVVLQRSGSALGTSVAFLLELAPGLLLAPVAAWCAERLEPRRFLAGVASAQGTVLLPLMFVPSAGRLAALVILYAVIVTESALTAVSDPARNAVLPRLVADADLVRGNSLIGLAQSGARLVGGPLGGVLYAAGGLRTVTLCDLASYAVAALLLARVDVPRARPVPGRGTGRARTVWRLPAARRLLSVTFGCQVAQGMFVVLFVLFVVGPLGGDAGEVGLLRGLQAVGAIAGGLTLVVLARHASPAGLVAGSTLVFGALSLVIWNGPSVTTTLWPYVTAFVLVGAPGVVLGAGLTSGLQSAVPPALHGRVFALNNVASYAGQGVGILAAGLLTAPLGLGAVLDVQGSVYVAVGLVATGFAVRAPRGPAVPRPEPRAVRV